MIRVLLADDQTLFRKGLRRLLEADGRFQVVAEADNGRAAMDLYRSETPQVLVTDVVMPYKDGLDVTKELIAFYPDAHILVLTMHEDLDHASRVLRAGARGFLSKNAAPEDLVEAIETVARGDRYLARPLALSLVEATIAPNSDELSPLTDREFQVMRLIAVGMRNRDIASELSISQKTVDTHRANVLKKLGLKTNADVARYAIRRGYIEA